MSKKLQLADIRVKIWFQNRRARERRERNGVIRDFKTKDEKVIPLDGGSEEKFPRIPCNSKESSESRPNQQSLVAHIKPEFNSVPLDFSTNFVNIFPRNDGFQNNYVSNPYLATGFSVFLPSVNRDTNKDDNS